MALEVLTTAKFSTMIEEIVRDKRIPYMEAVVHYCEMENMEIEVAAKLLSAVVKSKIEAEAQDLNYLPRVAKLPI